VTEGLSNSLLEAMAVGLPCVATAVGGAPDVIKNGFSGWLVSPDDPQALKSAIIDVLNDLPGQEGLKYQARAKITQEFALTTVASRLCLLYDSIWEQKN
jgi:L-malate glycosyltransferase